MLINIIYKKQFFSFLAPTSSPITFNSYFTHLLTTISSLSSSGFYVAVALTRALSNVSTYFRNYLYYYV